MRVYQPHERQEAIVGNSQNAYFAIAFGNVFYEPVDGVVRVSSVINRSRILWAVQRSVHHVVALRSVLAADVLHHADVSAFHDHFGSVVISVEVLAEVRTHRFAPSLAAPCVMERHLVGVVWSAR